MNGRSAAGPEESRRPMLEIPSRHSYPTTLDDDIMSRERRGEGNAGHDPVPVLAPERQLEQQLQELLAHYHPHPEPAAAPATVDSCTAMQYSASARSMTSSTSSTLLRQPHHPTPMSPDRDTASGRHRELAPHWTPGRNLSLVPAHQHQQCLAYSGLPRDLSQSFDPPLASTALGYYDDHRRVGTADQHAHLQPMDARETSSRTGEDVTGSRRAGQSSRHKVPNVQQQQQAEDEEAERRTAPRLLDRVTVWHSDMEQSNLTNADEEVTIPATHSHRQSSRSHAHHRQLQPAPAAVMSSADQRLLPLLESSSRSSRQRVSHNGPTSSGQNRVQRENGEERRTERRLAAHRDRLVVSRHHGTRTLRSARPEDRPLMRRRLPPASGVLLRKCFTAWYVYCDCCRRQQLEDTVLTVKYDRAVSFHDATLLQECIRHWHVTARRKAERAERHHRQHCLRRALQALAWNVCRARLRRTSAARFHYRSLATKTLAQWRAQLHDRERRKLGACFLLWRQHLAISKSARLVAWQHRHRVLREIWQRWHYVALQPDKTSSAVTFERQRLLHGGWMQWRRQHRLACQRRLLHFQSIMYDEKQVLFNAFQAWHSRYRQQQDALQMQRFSLLSAVFSRWWTWACIGRRNDRERRTRSEEIHQRHLLANTFHQWRVRRRDCRADRHFLTQTYRSSFTVWQQRTITVQSLCHRADQHHHKCLVRDSFHQWIAALSVQQTNSSKATQFARHTLLAGVVSSWKRAGSVQRKSRLRVELFRSHCDSRLLHDTFTHWRDTSVLVEHRRRSRQAFSDHCTRKAFLQWRKCVYRGRLQEMTDGMVLEKKNTLMHAMFVRWYTAWLHRIGQQRFRQLFSRNTVQTTFFQWKRCHNQLTMARHLASKTEQTRARKCMLAWHAHCRHNALLSSLLEHAQWRKKQSIFSHWRRTTRTAHHDRVAALHHRKRVMTSCLAGWNAVAVVHHIQETASRNIDRNLLRRAFRTWRIEYGCALQMRNSAVLVQAQRQHLLRHVLLEWCHAARHLAQCHQRQRSLATLHHTLSLQHVTMATWRRQHALSRIANEHRRQHLLLFLGEVLSSWYRCAQSQNAERTSSFLQRLQHRHDQDVDNEEERSSADRGDDETGQRRQASSSILLRNTAHRALHHWRAPSALRRAWMSWRHAVDTTIYKTGLVSMATAHHSRHLLKSSLVEWMMSFIKMAQAKQHRRQEVMMTCLSGWQGVVLEVQDFRRVAETFQHLCTERQLQTVFLYWTEKSRQRHFARHALQDWKHFTQRRKHHNQATIVLYRQGNQQRLAHCFAVWQRREADTAVAKQHYDKCIVKSCLQRWLQFSAVTKALETMVSLALKRQQELQLSTCFRIWKQGYDRRVVQLSRAESLRCQWQRTMLKKCFQNWKQVASRQAPVLVECRRRQLLKGALRRWRLALVGRSPHHCYSGFSRHLDYNHLLAAWVAWRQQLARHRGVRNALEFGQALTRQEVFASWRAFAVRCKHERELSQELQHRQLEVSFSKWRAYGVG